MLKRALLATAASLLSLPVAFAATPLGFDMEDAFGQVIKLICPGKSALTCSTLDFIVAFGITFAVLYMAFNMVEVFAKAGQGAQKGLTMFAAMASIATAFYVWSQIENM